MNDEQLMISVLFYLISCALHKVKPDESKLEGIDMNLLYEMSVKHSLAAMVYIALQKGDSLNKIDSALAKEWKEVKEKAVRKNIMLDAERRQILAELEKRSIWYMPLKGSILKFYYPVEGMREMSDNDILYNGEFQSEVRDLFVSRGYTVASYGKKNHEIYEKAPIYNYEMHQVLFVHSSYPKLCDGFEDINERMLPDEDSAFGRHLSDEDFYLFNIAHSFKHYDKAGTGFRSLVDCYVLDREFSESMDWEYITAGLRKMEIEEYEKNSRSLAKHLLEKPEIADITLLPKEERRILENCYIAGTYGSRENRVIHNLKKYGGEDKKVGKTTKIGYFVTRLFPGREWCRESYPFFYKIPVLLPFFWIYRIVNTLLFRRKRAAFEVKTVLGYKNKK